MLPAYIQIHDAIKAEIDRGLWKIGSRLPSERALSEQYQVSRMTLRQAISLLVEEGILERRAGSGTYVASHRVQEKMRGTTSFTEIIKSQGKEPSSKVISYEKTHPSEQEIRHLGISPKSYIIRMERVRYADKIPVVYEVASIPERLIRGFDREAVTNHFFQTLVDNGYVIAKSQQVISADVASDSRASDLDIAPGHALLTLQQTSYLEDGQAFEFVRSQYVAGRFEFYLENQ